MELSSFPLHVTVTLAVLVFAALVAVVCDLLTKTNVSLRELNVELRVRNEMQSPALATAGVAPASAHYRARVADLPAAEPERNVSEKPAPDKVKRWASREALERGLAMAAATSAGPSRPPAPAPPVTAERTVAAPAADTAPASRGHRVGSHRNALRWASAEEIDLFGENPAASRRTAPKPKADQTEAAASSDLLEQVVAATAGGSTTVTYRLKMAQPPAEPKPAESTRISEQMVKLAAPPAADSKPLRKLSPMELEQAEFQLVPQAVPASNLSTDSDLSTLVIEEPKRADRGLELIFVNPAPVARQEPGSELKLVLDDSKVDASDYLVFDQPAGDRRETVLPAGFHDRAALARLERDMQAFTGTVVSIAVENYADVQAAQGKERAQETMRRVTEMIERLASNAFACPVREDEFVVAFGETGLAAKKRLDSITERLWDLQLRSVGTGSVRFAWSASEAANDPFASVLAESRGKTEDSRRRSRRAAEMGSVKLAVNH